MLEWGTFELMGLIAGLLGVNEQAACMFIMNIVIILYMFSVGFEVAACCIVGNEIGSGNLQMAVTYYQTF
jgi:Na+-driven multidrug efflux pump